MSSFLVFYNMLNEYSSISSFQDSDIFDNNRVSGKHINDKMKV